MEPRQPLPLPHRIIHQRHRTNHTLLGNNTPPKPPRLPPSHRHQPRTQPITTTNLIKRIQQRHKRQLRHISRILPRQPIPHSNTKHQPLITLHQQPPRIPITLTTPPQQLPITNPTPTLGTRGSPRPRPQNHTIHTHHHTPITKHDTITTHPSPNITHHHTTQPTTTTHHTKQPEDNQLAAQPQPPPQTLMTTEHNTTEQNPTGLIATRTKPDRTKPDRAHRDQVLIATVLTGDEVIIATRYSCERTHR